jgi:uncharacterized protein YneF (UPF0154 family)
MVELKIVIMVALMVALLLGMHITARPAPDG